MTSFIQTMCVFAAPPLFPRPPKPLAPVYTFEQGQASIPRSGLQGDELLVHCSPAPSSRPSRWLWSPIKLLFRGGALEMSGARMLKTIRLVKASHGNIQSQTEGPTTPIVEYSLCEKSGAPDYFMTPLSPPLSPDTSDSETGQSLDSAPAIFNYSFSSDSSAFSETEVDNVVVYSNARARGPFKPQKSGRGTSSWQLRQFAEATLGSGSLRKAVQLPEGEDLNEWLAVNVVDFYNQINLLYGSITEFCSPQTCPEMKATDEFEYLWQDSESFKRPTKMPAPEYIEHLMVWCQNNIDNEDMFPSRIGVSFPKTFPALVRQMFKRLYRVYAHIYCHHYPVILQLGLEPHLNTSFKHYVLFIDEHGLAQGKDFWGPLGDLVESMLKSD